MSYEYRVELAKYFLIAKHKKKFKLGEQIKQELKKIIPKKQEFDLGRINPFLQDPSVSLIQCDGRGIPLKINKDNETIQTDIALSEDEINEIINKFSLRSGQPLTEPVFHAETNGLKIMAIISKYVGSKFIITKLK